MISVSAQAIADFLGGPLIGANVTLNGVASPQSLAPGKLLFASRRSDSLIERLNGETAALILAAPDFAGALTVPHILIARPRLAFARVAERFFVVKPPAVIAATARLGARVTLGRGVRIGEYSVIGDDVAIGDDSEIRNHVVIGNKVRLGRRALIKSHAVIGEEGFGFEKDEDGHWLRLPHFGGCDLGDDVEIGCFTTICGGTIDPTVIEDRAKIDDHVHIAHNCRIGSDCAVIANAEVSGSVALGRGSWVGPNACIIDGIAVGEQATVGMGAVVVKSVPDGATMAGSPAREMEEFKALQRQFKALAEQGRKDG